MVTNLAPGTYEVRGELERVRAEPRRDVAVGAGDVKPLDLSLAVASVAEAVTVLADATRDRHDVGEDSASTSRPRSSRTCRSTAATSPT